MLRYTLKRILTGILSLFVLATVTFFLVRMIPGSPFQRRFVAGGGGGGRRVRAE